MQTFVPENNFKDISLVLDNKRLGKQRVEVLQILKANLGMTKGWVNHPASIMWRENLQGLSAYGVAICEEWISRGFNDTCLNKIYNLVTPDADDLPYWWGREDIMVSHRSNLLRKAPEHYRKFWASTPYDLPYVWAKPFSIHVAEMASDYDNQ